MSSTRTYVVGLPVVLTVSDDGKVTYEVDLSEASEIEIVREDYEDDQTFRDREAQMNADGELIDAAVQRLYALGGPAKHDFPA